MRALHRSPRGAGFTLVELLVVMVIILLVSAVTLPTVLPALQHQQVSEAARILQAELQRCRDLASRSGVPQGIRFLIDKPLAQSGRPVLAYSSFVNVEASPDYSEGLAAPILPAYAGVNPTGLGICGPSADANGNGLSPTSWYWNIRVGDRIRFNNTGPFYTVVGPAFGNNATSVANTEGFVNEGQPGATPSGPVDANGLTTEKLFLTNGIDDDNDGYTDEPFDGLGAGRTNESERLIGSLQAFNSYVIKRRPAVNPRSRVVSLPSDVVIDATGYGANGTYTGVFLQERSRLPLPSGAGLDPANFGYFDIIFSPNGQVLTNSATAGYASLPTIPFYHFWLTERDGVVDLPASQPGAQPYLPVQPGSPVGTGTLKAERRLVTLFTRSGFVVVKQVENLVDPAAAAYDANYPYRDAQAGIKDKP